MVDYADILTQNYPGSQWRMDDTTDYSTLVWVRGNDGSKPTQQELDNLTVSTKRSVIKNRLDSVAKSRANAEEQPEHLRDVVKDALVVVIDLLVLKSVITQQEADNAKNVLLPWESVDVIRSRLTSLKSDVDGYTEQELDSFDPEDDTNWQEQGGN